mmetsp:Transcript_24118/g.52703  ORF Transcript_24118/g.52703 Transcript_24118/m.52703 type:complete len:155 (+) Transcript_24118:190-654(+)
MCDASFQTEPCTSQNYDCAICYNLLFLPIVGPCGHEFCYTCINDWAKCKKQDIHNPLACPVCRAPWHLTGHLLPSACQRYHQLLETLFPEQMAQRQAELADIQARRRQQEALKLRLQQQELSAAGGAHNNAQPSRLVEHVWQNPCRGLVEHVWR